MKCLIFGTIALLSVLASPDRIRAQESSDSNPYSPPQLQAGEAPIDLIDAVQKTLEHDPNLLLQEEDVSFQEGVAQELAGSFDWTIMGELSYQHEERELRDSVKRREQDRRTDLRDLNRETCTAADQLEAKAEEIRMSLASDPGDVRITEDELFDAVLMALEELIRVADSPEERDALIAQYTALLESELFETEALAQGNRDACNDSADELARIGEAPELEDFDTARLNVRADKLLRNGILLSPFVESEFEATQFVGKRNGFFETVTDDDGEERERFVDFGGKNIEDLYTVRVGFEVNVPLLRNRGADAVAAGENAARKDLEAVALLFQHAASESVLNTALAYWNLLAAQRRFDILHGSVELQEELVTITRNLVDGDELAEAELARVLASDANAKAQRDAGARELVTARMRLVQAMGYDAPSQDHAPLAKGEFPKAPSKSALEALHGEHWVEAAVDRRYDVEAAKRFAESGVILARAAGVNQRSRLDFSGRIWSTATGESSFSNAVDRWVTPSWRLGLAFEKPLGNSERLGQLAQSEARARQDQISAADLARNVRIAVVQTLSSLVEARDRLERAREAEGYFEKTIRDELEKFKLGDSTLVDTIVTEQQRTGALLSRLDAELDVAVLLAQLRFETGTMVAKGEEVRKSHVTRPMITTLPKAGAGS